MKNLKIELHLLQSFPPSCLNRDDTNTPKSCEFGGITRARVSSQCWKRAIREFFMDQDDVTTAKRTLRLRSEIIDQMNAAEWNADLLPHAVDVFITAYYAKTGGKESGESSALVFIGKEEIKEAALCIGELKDKLIELATKRLERALAAAKKKDTEEKAVKSNAEKAPPKELTVDNKINVRLLISRHYTDIALFGRMIAVNPRLNIDAACQVAHAISTHSVNLELDFFTAVDDLKDTNDNDDAGAGMLGTVGYDSACYYRYALVDYVQLAKNLNASIEDADASLEAFLKAFCDAIPGAKKNSFAHGNPPFLTFFVVRREGTPASLVNAFAKPVNARRGDLLEDSATALAHQVGKLNQCYELYEDTTKVKTFLAHILDSPQLEGLPTQQNVSMKKAIAGVMEAVKELREAQA